MIVFRIFITLLVNQYKFKLGFLFGLERFLNSFSYILDKLDHTFGLKLHFCNWF